MRRSSSILALVVILCVILSAIPNTETTMMDTAKRNHNEIPSTPTTNHELSANEFEVNRNWNINIVFVGYDSEVVNSTRFVSQLPNDRIRPYGNLTYNWNVNYNVVWANQTYESTLKTFMFTNSVNGTDTGTKLNETALLLMEADSIPRDCFDPRDGRSINGTMVEEWLIENPAVPTPDLGWTFYLLNYSEIDNADHSLEHWFDYDVKDYDSGERMDWFRLEWDNELNQDIKYQYAGVGGLDKVYILDASADQWYTNWAQLWWDGTYSTAVGPHIRYDFDTYFEGMDLQILENQNNVTDYLAGYSYGIVSNLLVPDIHASATPTERASFRVMVFAMDDITVENITWIDSEELVDAAINEALPFAEWYVQIDFMHIDDYSDWNTTFWAHSTLIGNETIVDGLGMFYDIYNNLRPNYWLNETYDMAVFGAVFVKEGMV
ncbi:MAG: hypothetical protein ACFFEV_01940, partial [Candidatus Thorarchaeota archaeon]